MQVCVHGYDAHAMLARQRLKGGMRGIYVQRVVVKEALAKSILEGTA